MGILDIVLVVLGLVSVIIGLKVGFAKMISKVLCILLALAGAIVATLALSNVVTATAPFASLQQIASGWFTQDFMTAQVTSAESLTALLESESAGLFGILKGIAPQIYDGMTSITVMEINTLGGYLGFAIMNLLVCLLIWLVSYLILKYILLGVKKLLTLIAQAPVLRSVDKIAGVAVSVTVCYVLAIGVLYTALIVVAVKFFPDTLAPSLKTMVDESSLFNVVHHTNLLGEFLGQLIGVNVADICPIA